MKRSLLSKLVLGWCGFYSLILFGSVAVGAQRQDADWRVIGNLIFFAVMAYGSIGLYGRKTWAIWICAGTLTLLTASLPLGYFRIASLPGNDPNRLAVTFSILALLNVAAVAYLVSRGYRAWRTKIDEKREKRSS
jgi:hypothetical protein